MARRSRRAHFFIQHAIKHPGALRAYVKKEFGEKGFTERGTIKPEITDAIARGKCPVCLRDMHKCICPTRLEQRRAVLARTLRRLHRT